MAVARVCFRSTNSLRESTSPSLEHAHSCVKFPHDVATVPTGNYVQHNLVIKPARQWLCLQLLNPIGCPCLASFLPSSLLLCRHILRQRSSVSSRTSFAGQHKAATPSAQSEPAPLSCYCTNTKPTAEKLQPFTRAGSGRTASCSLTSAGHPLCTLANPSPLSGSSLVPFLVPRPAVTGAAAAPQSFGSQDTELSGAGRGEDSGSNPGREHAGAVEAAAATAAPPNAPDAPLIFLPGGGMFFYWQLGALDALSRRYDLSGAHFHGASAGALAGTLAACQVDGRGAAEAAFRLSLENKIWDNPAGLAGVWGPLVREWLDMLLPSDAAERCSSRLYLQVLELPSISRKVLRFQHAEVNTFRDKADVIDCCMASVHIPFFMDKQPWTRFRGRRCVDGSILAPSLAQGGESSRRPILILDYTLDEVMKQRRWEFLSLGEGGHEATWDWIQSMMVRGGAFVDELGAKGQLPVMKPRNSYY